ncbi:MAG: shikimate dehydrogenase family protein [Micromonosporaceae bacterium]
MKAAVLGSPVAHSLSPVLHRAAYAALGLTGWTYEAIECDEAALSGLLDGLDDTWAGLSLTMPLKRAVMPLLDEVDPLAVEVGGANTVVFTAGRRHGYNTDVGGIVDALAEAGVTTCADALIIGAGATACSALAALREIGVREATAAVRDPARAGELSVAARRLGVAVHISDLATLTAEGVTGGSGPSGSGVSREGSVSPRDGTAEGSGLNAPAGAGLVICTVPPGAGDAVAEWLFRGPSPPRVVFDVAYDPWPTKLALAAQAAGATVASGFDLLLHQAARQVELMTGCAAPLGAMRSAGEALLARRRAARAHSAPA